MPDCTEDDNCDVGSGVGSSSQIRKRMKRETFVGHQKDGDSLDDNSKDLRMKYSEENSQKSEDDDFDVGSGVGSSNQVAAARLEVAPDMQLSFVKMEMKRMKRGSYYRSPV